MAAADQSAPQVSATDIARWLELKQRRESDHLERHQAIVSLVGTAKNPDVRIAQTHSGDWLCAAGTWIHTGGIDSTDTTALLSRYLSIGAHALAQELDGTFTLAIGDTRNDKIILITDPRGSLHVYAREDAAGTAICTSSMALSTNGCLDPIGTYEFITMGIIYEDRSLWAGIRKLPPASIIEITNGRSTVSSYWSFRQAISEPLDLDQAADALVNAMSQTLKSIGAIFQPVLADLTGGYDSRLLLLGLIESGIQFENTVVGPIDSPDVTTAQKIADKLGLPLYPVQESPTLDTNTFDAALRLGDGEYNAFDYANIMRNQAPFVKNHGVSLNGSFGEVARGYWWELLWPHLNSSTPMNAEMLARKRFAAIPYSQVFKTPPATSLAEHMSGVIARTIEPVKDLPLASQMDYAYLELRMQRWQGRIASNTNQIWPALSPLGFTSVLTPMLASRPENRFRSLLPRHVFQKHHPVLANIPLEHGFPPTVATLRNLHRFSPLYNYYRDKVLQKVGSKFGLNKTEATLPPSATERYQALIEGGLTEFSKSPRLMQTGLFDDQQTIEFLDPSPPIGGNRLVQWQRLISLETTLNIHANACENLHRKLSCQG